MIAGASGPGVGARERRSRDALDRYARVLDAIPEACLDHNLVVVASYLARDLLLYAACLVALSIAHEPYVVVPLWLLSALAVSGLFILGHDAAHQALFRNRRLNMWAARILMLPSGQVAASWVLGHNRVHHRFTVCEGRDFVWHPLTVEQYEALSRWRRAVHRVEWSALGVGVYYLHQVWWDKMVRLSPPAKWRRAIHRDTAFLVTAHVAALVAVVAAQGFSVAGLVSGLFVWAKLILVPFLLFNCVIGWVVHLHHVSPDVAWLPRERWDRFGAQVEGTTIYRAPRWLDFFLHSIFEHAAHHVDTRIPMYRLREANDHIVAAFPNEVHVDRLRFGSFFANARRCKLYEFERSRWLHYRDARPPS